MPKENARTWVDCVGDRLPVPNGLFLIKKSFVMYNQITQSNFCYEILHDGVSVNAERYIEFLEHMVEVFQTTIPIWE